MEGPVVAQDSTAGGRVGRLVARLLECESRGAFVDECLDAVVDAIGADRGLVVLLDGDGSILSIQGRRRGRALSPSERQEISRTIIADAMRERRTVVWEQDASAARSDSMATLGILAAAATPLRRPRWRSHTDSLMGALYVDSKKVQGGLEGDPRGALDVAAIALALTIELAEGADESRERLRCLASVESRGSALELDELLAHGSLRRLRADVEIALDSAAPVLVVGESGTGKTELVRAMARASRRLPVVRSMLGTSDDLNTISSELFGHAKGAFSGALARRAGLVELADGGTLILDELSNLTVEAQKLLLDFTQYGEYRPLGWDRAEPKRADVRIFVCTNKDPLAAIREGKLRADLYYRLAGSALRVPALRDRRADIPELAQRHLAGLDAERRCELSPALEGLLMSPDLPWRGNLRELFAILTRAWERARRKSKTDSKIDLDAVTADDFGLDALPRWQPPRALLETSAPTPSGADLGAAWRSVQAERAAAEAREASLIAAALEKHGGVIAHAARELGIARTSLSGRLASLRPAPRGESE